MNDYDSDNATGYQPGFIQRIFIHFAGADPDAFQYLKEVGKSEANEFAKLGFTVLVPFIMALGAGTFTIYTLMDPKSLAISLTFGVVWAIMILAIDVAIMSQLVKRVEPPASVRSQRAFSQASPPKPRKRPSNFRNFLLALCRITIAATLGALISHCIVLAVFKNRVAGQMEAARAAKQKLVNADHLPDLKEKEAVLAEAQRVANLADPDAFYTGYGQFLQMLAKSDPAGAAASPALPGEGDGTVEDPILKPFALQKQSATEEFNEKDAAAARARAEVNAIELDKGRAQKMIQDETKGIVRTYSFDSIYFQSMPIKSTSGKEGKGSQAAAIQRYSEGSDKELARLRAKADGADAEAKTANDALTAAKKKYQEQQMELINAMSAAASQRRTEMERQKSSAITEARAALAKRIATLQKEMDNLRGTYDRAMNPISGDSYDLIEATEALHDLALGRAEPGMPATKHGAVLALILILMACLFFIDITPLMMKMLHQPGAYEGWKAWAQQEALMPGAFNRPENPARDAPPSWSGGGYPSGPKRPPPPPPVLK